MKCFTLIELLVVIAIIGILSTLLIPVFKEEVAQEKVMTEQDKCKRYENYSQKDLPVKCLKYYK